MFHDKKVFVNKTLIYKIIIYNKCMISLNFRNLDLGTKFGGLA